jgi:hypothetical protein
LDGLICAIGYGFPAAFINATALKNAFAFALCSPTALRKDQIGCFGQVHRKANEAEKGKGGGVWFAFIALDRSDRPSMQSFPQIPPATTGDFLQP